MYRGDLTGKFQPNMFFKTKLLVAGFYCTSILPQTYLLRNGEGFRLKRLLLLLVPITFLMLIVVEAW